MRAVAIAFAAVLVIGCAGSGPGVAPRQTTLSASPVASDPPPTAGSASLVPICDDVPPITAPAEHYGDSPIYVGNEMPDDELRAWAATKPGFEGLWIDPDHHNWVTLAFSRDADARQAELATEFPGVGAVAVAVDWTTRELEAIRARVGDMPRDIVHGWGIAVDRGVVTLFIGVLSPGRMEAVASRFAGERVCVTGADPEDVPSDGPQPQVGSGWRLLADADGTGPAYRTGIAWDDESYAELWRTAELTTPRPTVDFGSEVVIWFGVVTGSICPPIRMDDVVVDTRRAAIYPEIVHIGFGSCTDDIHPHAYVVAYERSRLPAPPFALVLDPEFSGAGERTIIDADLTAPASIARPGEVRVDDSPPEPQANGPGAIVETGFPFEYRQATECGLEWLGPINDTYWRTEQADSAGWIPAEWRDAVEGREITLRALIRAGPPPVLRATAAGHTVAYEASPDEAPSCD